MIAKLTAPLRAAPATVPALAVIALFGFWTSEQAGFPLTHWAPVGLVALGLLCVTAWALRGLLAGGARLLAGVALLSRSRGSFYATPVMLVLVFALVPGRLRTFVLLVPVAGAVAAVAPTILHVGDNAVEGLVAAHDVHRAVAAIAVAAAVVAVLVAAGSLLEARAPLSAAARARVRTGVAAAALAALVAAVAGG